MCVMVNPKGLLIRLNQLKTSQTNVSETVHKTNIRQCTMMSLHWNHSTWCTHVKRPTLN